MSLETQLAEVVALAIKAATAPLAKRIADLETQDRLVVVGPQGERGEKGLAGDRGESVPGVPGRDGCDGKDGASISTGSGAPTFAGRSGDVYLNATTGDVYQCR